MVMGENILIGILIGLVAYVLLNLGKGIQKMAIEGLKVEKKLKSKNSGVWIFGTILTSIYMFVQWIALVFAPVNVIAPLEGLGLIVLIIFSYFVLNEDITKVEILGIVLIVTGVILVTSFNPNPSSVESSDFDLVNFIITFSVIFIIEGVFIIFSSLKKYTASGLILGATAGSFMAFQTVSKRITAIPDPYLTIAFSLMTLIFAGLTLTVTQIAFAKSKANRVVPCFTSASISLSIVIGVITLKELILIIQIIGIIIIIFGVILLTAFRKESEI
jgi:uncharacterized membrane protein